MSDSPAYLSPANRFFSSFQIDWWQCMHEPLSPKIGLGMNVAVRPLARATFLTTYLYHMVQSAIFLRLLKRIDSSHWPPVATSWWKTYRDAHLLERHGHVGAEIVQRVGRRDREVAALVGRLVAQVR